jgi:hypothetical protein
LAWWRCPHGDAAMGAHICCVTSPTSEPATLCGIERQIAPRELTGHEGEEQTRAHLQLLRLAQQLTADLGDRGVLTVALAEGEDNWRRLLARAEPRPATSTSAPPRLPNWPAKPTSSTSPTRHPGILGLTPLPGVAGFAVTVHGRARSPPVPSSWQWRQATVLPGDVTPVGGLGSGPPAKGTCAMRVSTSPCVPARFPFSTGPSVPSQTPLPNSLRVVGPRATPNDSRL